MVFSKIATPTLTEIGLIKCPILLFWFFCFFYYFRFCLSSFFLSFSNFLKYMALPVNLVLKIHLIYAQS